MTAEQVDLGRVDVAIGVFSAPPDRFRSSFLFEYDDVLIVAAKYKLGKLDKLDKAKLALLEETELAAIVPRPLAKALAVRHPVATHELPYPTALVEVRLLWHQRTEGDQSHEWLHEILRRVTEPLRASNQAK